MFHPRLIPEQPLGRVLPILSGGVIKVVRANLEIHIRRTKSQRALGGSGGNYRDPCRGVPLQV